MRIQDALIVDVAIVPGPPTVATDGDGHSCDAARLEDGRATDDAWIGVSL